VNLGNQIIFQGRSYYAVVFIVAAPTIRNCGFPRSPHPEDGQYVPERHESVEIGC
jgi:hypothetical protein